MDMPSQAYDVRFNNTPDGPVLVRGRYAFELNEVGLAIWQRCDGSHSRQRIVGDIQTMCDVTAEQAECDVDFFLAELARARLIER